MRSNDFIVIFDENGAIAEVSIGIDRTVRG